MGFRGGGGQLLVFAIDFNRCPYNTLALPYECVIYVPSLVFITQAVFLLEWG